MYDEGLLNIVQNVGYENPNRSHFRSTDIWLSGSDSDVLLFDGWAGRFLTKIYPDYPGIHPTHPGGKTFSPRAFGTGDYYRVRLTQCSITKGNI